jgi:hypothetical protein
MDALAFLLPLVLLGLTVVLARVGIDALVLAREEHR